jgi:sigma-B regulation protein RsbU (phosphoserine phosphatase)
MPGAKLRDEMGLVAEMVQGFAASFDIDQTLKLGLSRIADAMRIEAALVFLTDEASGDLVCHACFGPVDLIGFRVPPGRGIIGRTVAQDRALIVKDVGRDPDYFGRDMEWATGYAARTILCAPMRVRGACLGAIELFNKQDGSAFSAADARLLTALAASAALALFNARLAAEMVEQERVRRDLALAGEIQRAMLPEDAGPACPVHGINHAARHVSGDFFDIVPLADGRWGFALGDVAGKGMNAALLMAKAASLFRCLVKTGKTPAALLAGLNAELCETSTNGLFVTMVAGLVSADGRSVCIANAGHEPPVMVGPRGVRSFKAEAPPLGILPELEPASFPELSLTLDEASLYVFTDGLTEATGADGAMLGEEGALELIRARERLPPAARLESLLAAFGRPGIAIRDDVTILLVEPPAPMSGLRLTVAARPEHLQEIRARVRSFAQAEGASPDLTSDLVLAVDEACQNIIRHAYCGGSGLIVLEGDAISGEIEFRLLDFAPACNPAMIESRPLEDIRPGGLGTHLMRSVMDEVVFLTPPPGYGNLLRMRKRL